MVEPALVAVEEGAQIIHPVFEHGEAVDAALYEDRSLVRHHAMRRTIWVFTRPTANVAHNSTTRRIASSEERRLAKLIEDNGTHFLRVAYEEVLYPADFMMKKMTLL